jgi:transcription elongation factor GreA
MINRETYLSPKKFDELSTELSILKTNGRKDIAEKLEFAKSLGDLSENAEYHEARNEQAILEERISKLENILKNAQIISHTKKDIVGIGSHVTIDNVNGVSEEWSLVGSEEVDLENKKISNESPLGNALFGKKKGDTFSIKTTKGEKKYKIVKLN